LVVARNFDLKWWGSACDGTAGFGTFGIVFNISKGMVPLVYAVGLVAMGFTALSHLTISRAFPVAGSVYAPLCHLRSRDPVRRLGFNTTANFLGIETTARLNKILMVMQLAFLGLFMILAIFALSRGIAGRSCPSSRCTGLLRSARA